MNGIKSIVFACALAALITMPDTGHSQAGQSQLVNPDLASEKEILALPHMTAALAKSIMEQRPFLSMADLNTLLSKTLSKDQLAELYGKMFVHVDLNRGSDAELLLIPGIDANKLRAVKAGRI